MPLNERIYKLEQLLKNRAVVPFALMQERTEASRATLNRDIQFMRDRLRMPVVFDKELGGYQARRRPRQAGADGAARPLVQRRRDPCAAHHAAAHLGSRPRRPPRPPPEAPHGPTEGTARQRRQLRQRGQPARARARRASAQPPAGTLRRRRLRAAAAASASTSATAPATTTSPPSARSPPSAWSITATTGISTAGAT
jgi:hypothetical protein